MTDLEKRADENVISKVVLRPIAEGGECIIYEDLGIPVLTAAYPLGNDYSGDPDIG